MQLIKKVFLVILISLFLISCANKQNWISHLMNTTYWYAKANSQFQLGKYKEAVNSYNQALKLEPKNPTFWYRKALALQKLSSQSETDYKGPYGKKAIHCLETALKLTEKNPGPLRDMLKLVLEEMKKQANLES